MCGIIGVVARPGRFSPEAIARAVGTLDHRGPDDRGVERVFSSDRWEAWFGHTRLAVVDLSPAGHQPMVRAGKGAIVFNGEIYNHLALRRELSAKWEVRSRSDTEVLLAGVLGEQESFFAKTNGMMACAVLDDARSSLVLARDRIGKKPLYYYCDGEILAFASELKALRALGLDLEEDPLAWAYFRWLGYVPHAYAIYRRCQKLPAATHATIDLSADSLRVTPVPYWDALGGYVRTFDGEYEDAIGEFARLLDDATRIRLEADVPVGIFLSGGIDSSLVAASIARQHGKRITAFVVRAADARFDESARAVRTARLLGLDVEVLDPDPSAYKRQVGAVPYHFDEPHAALSQIAVMGNAELARRSVTVVLTGDGGDEVFLGYPWVSYPRRIQRYMRVLRAVPGGQRLLPFLRTTTGGVALRAGLRAVGLNAETATMKLDIFERALSAREPGDVYEEFQVVRPAGRLSAADRALLGDDSLLTRARRWYPTYSWDAAANRSLEELAGALDLVTYLRDDVVQKVERATMAYALEARSPLLDYRIVELGCSFPRYFKVKGGVFKRLLRDACRRMVDPELADLPKQGFGTDEPAGLDPGESVAIGWAVAVEQAWHARWSVGDEPR